MIPNEQRERMIRSSATENERFLLGLLDEARSKPQPWVEFTKTHKVWHYPYGSTFSIDRCLLNPTEVGYLPKPKES